jgi:hypothetical protein
MYNELKIQFFKDLELKNISFSQSSNELFSLNFVADFAKKTLNGQLFSQNQVCAQLALVKKYVCWFKG